MTTSPTILQPMAFETMALLQQPAAPNPIASFIPLILIFGIFWFLVIRPSAKRQRELQATIEGLKRGDKILTHGGLFGEVAAVEPAAVVLKIADGVKVKVAKTGIAGLAEAPGAEG